MHLYVKILYRLLLCLPVTLFCLVPSAFGGEFRLQKLADGIYAAIAQPDGRAASNALIIVTNSEVILAGAHFSPEVTRELISEIDKITPLPLRRVILTHHHRGYNYLDFDLPPSAEVITSWQAWKNIKSEYREMKNPVLFFDKGISLQRGTTTIILSTTEEGHTEGDVVLYIPNARVLFTSDLVFNDSVGFMGDGHMRAWVQGLQTLEEIGARVVVPGVGGVTDAGGIRRFRVFLQEFFTELLRHMEKGESLAETKKRFSLPAYEEMPGYNTFFNVNVERAYKELKGDVPSISPESRKKGPK
jgi:glyoxylase-like metal-dependent hydrolase (beta-lactamase superfamily II)